MTCKHGQSCSGTAVLCKSPFLTGGPGLTTLDYCDHYCSVKNMDPVQDPPIVHKPRSLQCKWRGGFLHLQDCTTCSGRVSLKVFSCPKHHKCTLNKQLQRVACCAVCPDYEEALQ